MNTVKEFFEKVFLNEYHNIRVKSSDTDKVICEANSLEDIIFFGVEDKTINDFATDWEKRTYILWV